jgi:hypothetical protein
MSEEATLEGELLKWAKGNEARKNKWLTELIENDVEDLQTLKDLAESSGWQRTLDKLSGVLVAKLESWFSDNFSQSKLFRTTNCPIFLVDPIQKQFLQF